MLISIFSDPIQIRQFSTFLLAFRFRQRSENRRLQLLKEEFGGGERGETLLKTYLKLQQAYEKEKEERKRHDYKPNESSQQYWTQHTKTD